VGFAEISARVTTPISKGSLAFARDRAFESGVAAALCRRTPRRFAILQPVSAVKQAAICARANRALVVQYVPDECCAGCFVISQRDDFLKTRGTLA
jgi:hypothetical protein